MGIMNVCSIDSVSAAAGALRRLESLFLLLLDRSGIISYLLCNETIYNSISFVYFINIFVSFRLYL